MSHNTCYAKLFLSVILNLKMQWKDDLLHSCNFWEIKIFISEVRILCTYIWVYKYRFNVIIKYLNYQQSSYWLCNYLHRGVENTENTSWNTNTGDGPRICTLFPFLLTESPSFVELRIMTKQNTWVLTIGFPDTIAGE